jgi:hypothetical protein
MSDMFWLRVVVVCGGVGCEFNTTGKKPSLFTTLFQVEEKRASSMANLHANLGAPVSDQPVSSLMLHVLDDQSIIPVEPISLSPLPQSHTSTRDLTPVSFSPPPPSSTLSTHTSSPPSSSRVPSLSFASFRAPALASNSARLLPITESDALLLAPRRLESAQESTATDSSFVTVASPPPRLSIDTSQDVDATYFATAQVVAMDPRSLQPLRPVGSPSNVTRSFPDADAVSSSTDSDSDDPLQATDDAPFLVSWAIV